jgi:hypothetical protein
MADRHKLELRGYGELLAEFCELADRVAAIEVEVAALRQAVTQLQAIVKPPLIDWNAVHARYEIHSDGHTMRDGD